MAAYAGWMEVHHLNFGVPGTEYANASSDMLGRWEL